tara:strand:+ start:68 stop:535 length:468 start_codon:yes stop_codon:yes gene_type:complete
MDKIHQKWMKYALKEAKFAYTQKEIPVGAIIVYENEIIGKGYNQIELLKDPTAHAEMIAITSAANFLQDWRLNSCDMYVTLEPCCMCAGAINRSRLRNIFFGAYNDLEGCVTSKYNLCNDPSFSHQSGVKGGIMQVECSFLLHSFFKDNSSSLSV